VGLSSYLLINFWHTRVAANKAAIKAIVVNRISDAALYFSLVIIFFLFKTFDFFVINSCSQQLSLQISTDVFQSFFWLLNLACLCLFIGAMGKSAQLGLHT
jgi:NADH:ubiquinone oxidoreductase subunit 5 (subunit L)/multisubunit Na+/H+ antiporter MnhA subunit